MVVGAASPLSRGHALKILLEIVEGAEVANTRRGESDECTEKSSSASISEVVSCDLRNKGICVRRSRGGQPRPDTSPFGLGEDQANCPRTEGYNDAPTSEATEGMGAALNECWAGMLGV